MEPVLFYTIIALALYFAGRGFLSSGPGYFTLPSLFGIVILFWVVPQLTSIRAAFPYLEQSLSTIYIMVILAMLGTKLGWSMGNANGRRGRIVVPNRQILFGTTIVLTAIAGITTLLIRDVGEGIGGMQTGIVTILLFFNNLKIIALFLSFYMALHYRSRASYVLLAINLLIYAPLILLYFRRRAMIELAVCLILSLWFTRRILVPRTLVLSALPLGFIVMFAVGALRTLAVTDGNWSYLRFADLQTIDFLAETPFADVSLAAEMLNAVYIAQLADLYGAYTLGTGTWNRLIFQWVPAQIVGADLKTALMLEDLTNQELSNRLQYSIRTGTTRTGFGDAYLEFSYFGMLFFILTAYIMGRLWIRGNRGDPWAMALFVGGLTPALISITHYAFYFCNAMLLFIIVIGLVRSSLSIFMPRKETYYRIGTTVSQTISGRPSQ